MGSILKVFGTDDQGKESWSKFYHRGDFFGETVMLSKGVRMATVQCITNATLLEINKEDFNWVFNKQS
jgi:CRP-like cAMP-binding protein